MSREHLQVGLRNLDIVTKKKLSSILHFCLIITVTIISSLDPNHHEPYDFIMAKCLQELTHRLGGRPGALPQIFLHGQHLGVGQHVNINLNIKIKVNINIVRGSYCYIFLWSLLRKNALKHFEVIAHNYCPKLIVLSLCHQLDIAAMNNVFQCFPMLRTVLIEPATQWAVW